MLLDSGTVLDAVNGAAGLFVICIVMLLAVAAHRRKAASMMDYDDD